MDAIVVRAFGGPDVLTLDEVPDPEPQAGEVLVELASVGVNYVEVYQRTGRYPGPLPRIPGGEGAGTVTAVGPGVESVRVGDRVCAWTLKGSYAKRALAAVDSVVPLPDEMDTEIAATPSTRHRPARSRFATGTPRRSTSGGRAGRWRRRGR
jgi:NADPH2:quinone reductase